MSSARKTETSLISKKLPFANFQLVAIIAVVVMAGLYAVSRIFAASGTLTLVPSATSVNVGDMVTVQVRENSGTDTVNVVQSNISYDATRLQYVGVSETGSGFGLVAQTANNGGVLQLARATQGGSPALTGDQLVTTVTFKALAVGTIGLTFSSGSAIVRSTDATDILAVKNGTTLTLADLAAPSIPTGLAAPSPALTSINLSWTASTDNVAVSSYRVYRNGTQVGSPNTTSYNDTGLAPNTSYSYKVAALDSAGNMSAQSTAFTVSTLPDTTAPSVPGKPTSATQTMTSISLAWTASTDNLAVTGYRVYRNGTLVASPTGLSYNDTGLTANTSYSYTVAAVDAAGNMSAQTAATAVKTLADTTAPSVPTALKATVTSTSVALTWTASTDNVAVTGYTVFDGNVQVATNITTPSYTATNVSYGTHSYTVLAYDAAGNKSAQTAAVSAQVYLAGDINKDTKVDVFDLSTLLTNWARTGTNTSDINGDSVVNVFDLSILLSRWTG